VRIGPLNALVSALIAEAHDDDGECLRALRLGLRRSLPLRARPPSRWAFLPHVTLGYWGVQPVAPLVEALRPFREVEPMTLTINTVRLTIYTRDPTPYRRDVLHTAQEEIIADYRLTP
jgi:2'-5' RNA ligase